MKVVLTSKAAQAVVAASYATLCTVGIAVYGSVAVSYARSRKRNQQLDDLAASMARWTEGYTDGYNAAVRSIKDALARGEDIGEL